MANEEQPRFPVRHRSGGGCGGLAFVARRRFAGGELLEPGDWETPDGRVLLAGESLTCAACGAPMGGEDLLWDLRAAGAFPLYTVRESGRARYLTPPDDQETE
jgi:hypothetical protein